MEVEDRMYDSGDIPSGPLASQIIKSWHTDTKNTIFPSDSLYAKDWSNALSYLGKKKHKTSRDDPRFTMESPRVYLPLQHPLEGRNNPQPSQSFIHWRVPSRYSDGDLSSTADQKMVEDILTDPDRIMSGRQHDITHTTHYAPPFGKFQPIRSEQQDHMSEILKKNREMTKYMDTRMSLPRLSSSARPLHDKSYSQRKSHSATEWWKNKPNYHKEHQPTQQFVERSKRAKVDQLLHRSGNLDAQKEFQRWFEKANENDRRAALHFLSSAKSRSQETPREEPPEITQKEENRLNTVFGLMGKIRPQASPPDPNVLLSIDRNVRALDGAAEKRHLRLYTPDGRSNQHQLHTWHQRPVHVHRARLNNVLSMYTTPNAPVPRDFRIHPEWLY